MLWNQQTVLSSIALASSLVVGACSEAEPQQLPGPSGVPEMQQVTYREKRATAVAGNVQEAARDYLMQLPELTGPGDEWVMRASRVGKDQLHHVRFRQRHEGVRVWGGDVVVHASDSQFRSVNGNRLKNLEGFDVVPVVDARSALATAKTEYARQQKNPGIAPLSYSRESTELVILPRTGRDARLAWRAVFFTELQAGIKPGLWNYFIDAKTGEVIQQFNGLHTLEQASGPGGNPKVARTWDMELDVEPQGSQFAMNTSKLRTVNMNQTTTQETLVVGPLSPIGDAAINDAHGFAEKMLDMLSNWMGVDSIDENGFLIKSRVHYDVQYENAFWDGTQMTYGDGATIFHPLSGAIDVVGHEIAHGFTEFHSNLIYDLESGAINESFSDIAGTILEFFDEGDAADFDIGRDIFQADEALRFMCDPTADGSSIDNYSDYTDFMDVHFTSGIMNKAFCRAVRRFSSGDPEGPANTASVRRVGEVFFEANANYWVESSSFFEACQGVLDAAAGLGYTDEEHSHLRESCTDVGVPYSGPDWPFCDETFTATSGEVSSPNFPANYPNNFSRRWCIETPTPTRLTFTHFNTEPDYDFVQVKDGHTGTVLSNTSGTTLPPGAVSTFLIIRFTTDSSVVRPGWRATWAPVPANVPPVVELTAPADGATISGNVLVTASALDMDGTVSLVKFGLPDGTTVSDSSAPYAISWDSTSVDDGMYNITAVAFDNLGVQSLEKSVSVDVSNATSCVDGELHSTHAPVAIPDNFPGGLASTLTVFNPGNIGALELSLKITHTWRGDLRVVLVSPTGLQHVVHDREGGGADNLEITGLELDAFAGIPGTGPWTLKVIDSASGDVGTLDSWSLAIASCEASGEFIGKSEPNLPLVDNGVACSTLTVSGGNGDASSVRLDLDGEHAYRAVLQGTLSHNGVGVLAFPVNTFPAYAGNFGFLDRPIAGLSGDVNGEWTLCIQDTDAFGDTGTLRSWSVHD